MTLRFKITIAVGLSVIFGFLGWSFYAMRNTGPWAGASGTLSAIIIGGVVGTGALTGALMWLAFYSARKGFDESPTFDTANPSPRPEQDDNSKLPPSLDPGGP